MARAAIPERLYNNPLDPAVVDHAVSLLDLSPDDVALDVGCGNGEILARVLERHGCRGIGIDKSPEEITAARTRLAAHADRVELHEADVHDVDLVGRDIAVALCIGSSHAFGGPGEAYANMLAALQRCVRPGGLLLIGEGYWKQDPADAYLTTTGIPRHELLSHAENVERAEDRGLLPLLVVTSSETTWDQFESHSWRAAEEHLRRHPEDPDAVARAEHWRWWRRAYLSWGRATMGFALYLYRTPT